jgi:hypothetical protein
MRNTAQLRQVWHPPCQRHGPLAFTFWNGVRVGIDGRITEALKALDQCLKAWNYRPKQDETWGYNCRRITGGIGYSLHAYGIAVDVNSRANPYGPRLITDMPGPMVAAIKSIKTKGGHRVWGWGGDYARNKDAMHYEVVASPAELRTGIDWRTVAGTVTTQTVTAPAPVPSIEEEDVIVPVHVPPGEHRVFHVEPTTNEGRDSAIGAKRAILVLNAVGDNRVPAWIYFQSLGDASPKRKDLWGGQGPFVTVVENKPMGWLDIANNGSDDIGGSLIYVR